MFTAWLLALFLQASPDGSIAAYYGVEQFDTFDGCAKAVMKLADNGQDVSRVACIGMMPIVRSI